MRIGWNFPVAVVFMLALAGGVLSTAQPADDEALFEATCSRCHPAKASWRNTRSAEQWKSTVERMRRHAGNGPKAFDAETAVRIAAYLAPTPREAATTTVVPGAPASPPATTTGESVGPPHDDIHGPRAAGMLGIAGGILLLLVIGSGLARRKLKRRFHRIHVVLVSVFGITLVIHAGLLFLQVGAPRTAWHLFGSVALATGVLNAAVGLGRRRLRRRFLPLHKVLAALILILAVLHRALA